MKTVSTLASQSQIPQNSAEFYISEEIASDVQDDFSISDTTKILEGIARGEQAILDGQIHSHEEAKQMLGKWLE